MNARHRCKLRRKLRRAAERAERAKDLRLAKNVAAALTGSLKVAKALFLIDYKASPRALDISYSSGDNTCLPKTALYRAGYRKSTTITAR